MAAEWPIGWIVSDLDEYWHTAPLLGANTVYSTKLGSGDDLNFAMGAIWDKTIYLAHAPRDWHAYASATMRQRFGIKMLFIGGTYEATGVVFPTLGQCMLQMPDIDPHRSDHLLTTIPQDNVESLSRLANALHRFREGAGDNVYNLGLIIHKFVQEIPGVLDGLALPDIERVLAPTYADWPDSENYRMCCGMEFNSGSYNNQIPCIKVLAVMASRGTIDNEAPWHKYATLSSAAAISAILLNINTEVVVV